MRASLLLLGLVCLAAPARAQDLPPPELPAPCPAGVIGCATQDVDFYHRQQLFDAIDLDSGWQPPGSPLQVRFGLRIAGQTEVLMGGTAITTWPSPLTVRVPGRPQTGALRIDYGIELIAKIKFDVEVAGIRYRWEGDIPVPGLPSDLRLAGETRFDPFLLPGASMRPVQVSDRASRIRVLSYDALGMFIPVPGVNGGIALDLEPRLDATYQTERIVISDAPLPIVEELRTVVIGPDRGVVGFGAAKDYLVRPEGLLSHDAYAVLYPTLYLTIAGRRFMLDLAELPVRVVRARDEVVFTDADVHVPLPDIALRMRELDLGVRPVGGTEERAFVIANDGEAELRVLPALNAGVFTLARGGELRVPPRSEAQLVVRFTPTMPGASADMVTLATNDPDEPLLAVRLRGVGEAPPDAGPPPIVVTDGGPPAAGDAGRSPIEMRGGCGCRAPGGSGDGAAWMVLIALGIVVVVRQRR